MVETFQQQWEQLKDYEEFLRYMTASWLLIRKQWALFERSSHVTLGNMTNNRIELQFGKLKLIISSRRWLSVCIRLLLGVLTSSDVISMRHQYADRCKICYRNGYTGVGAEYFELVTDYASRKIPQQIIFADSNKYEMEEMVSEVDENNKMCKVINIKTSDVYTVSDSCLRCTCSFNTSMLLPCCHVFKARQTPGLSAYDRALMAVRWLLTTHATSVDTWWWQP